MPLAEAEGMSTATCLSYPYPRAQDMLTPRVGPPQGGSHSSRDVGRLRAKDPSEIKPTLSASVH